jgi:transcriptional regulator with XRE-family HTH domain
MATETRTHVGEALRRRRKELGLTLGEVARAMGTSDGYVWKLEQGLINLQNVALPRLMGLLQALRWTPEEFTIATGVALPGLTEPQEPTPGVSLLKVPVWGEKDTFLVLGLPGEAPSPRDLRALRVPEGYLVFREGTPPEHGENAVAPVPAGRPRRAGSWGTPPGGPTPWRPAKGCWCWRRRTGNSTGWWWKCGCTQMRSEQ